MVVEIGNAEPSTRHSRPPSNVVERVLRHHAVLVGERRLLPSLQRRSRDRGRDLAFGEIDLRLRKTVEGRGGHAEVLGEQRLRRMPDPVGNAEGAELGEVAVIEHEDEMAGLVAERLEHVAVAARKIPDVARLEVVGLRAALRVDDGGTHPAFGNEGPLRGRGVPVQLAHDAGLHAHRDAGDALGNGQLGDGRFFAVAASHHLSFGLLQLELEGRQLLPRGHGIGNVVLEAGVAAFGADGEGRCKHARSPAQSIGSRPHWRRRGAGSPCC